MKTQTTLFCCVLLGLLCGCTKETRKARFVRSADKYYAAGQYQKAEIEYLNAVRLDPNQASLMERLGTIYFEQGRFERAFGFLTRAKELSADGAPLHFMLGLMYYSAGETAEARTELANAVEKDVNHPEALGLLAEASFTAAEQQEIRERVQAWQAKGDKAQYHIALGVLAMRDQNSAKAETEFKQAMALDPKLITAHLSLALLYWQRNDLPDAEREFRIGAELSPMRSPRRLKEAEFKAKTGKSEEAKRLLSDLVKAAPDLITAWQRLAELQLAEKETNACLASLQRIRSVEPGDLKAGLLASRVQLLQGKTADAVRGLESLRSRHARQSDVHYQLALAYLVNREPGKAIVSLQQCVTLNTNAYDAIVLLADLKTRKGDPAGAITLLTRLLKQHPNDEQASLLLAIAYEARGTPEDALTAYRNLIKAHPQNRQALYLMGLLLAQQKRPAEARQAFETVLEMAPEFPAALVQLVDLDLRDKSYDVALQRVQDAIQRHPKVGEFHALLAKVYVAQGDWLQAEAALRKCLELSPNAQQAHYALAKVLVDAQKADQALQELEKALARNPKDTGALLMIGILMEQRGDLARAQEVYERALAINPQHSMILNNLAYLYAVRLKKPDKGHPFALKARQLLPDEPATADTLGWINLLRGDVAAALPLLQESAAKLRNEAEVQYHLGCAYYAMGDEESARTALTRAVQGEKSYVGKDEAALKLSVLNKPPAGHTPIERIKELEKSLSQDADDLIQLTRLGAAFEAAGQMDNAKETADRILKINPKAVPAMLILVRVYGVRPDGVQQALEYAKSARAAAPSDGKVAHAAGKAAFEARQHEWAYSILQESSRSEPQDPEVFHDLACAAYSVGRVAEAEQDMQTALRLGLRAPHVEDAGRFLDMLALTKTAAVTTEATARIQRALAADSNCLPAQMASAVAWQQRGSYVEAQKIYEQILDRYPQFLPATRNLAILNADHLNNPQKGYEQAVKARQALPEDAELARTLGRLSYQRGEYRYAVQLLKEVQQKKAANADTYYYLGMSQYRLKQKSDSATSLRQALALNLEARLSDEARKVLAQFANP